MIQLLVSSNHVLHCSRITVAIGRTVNSSSRKIGHLASELNVVRPLSGGQNWDIPDRIPRATYQAVGQFVTGPVPYAEL